MHLDMIVDRMKIQVETMSRPHKWLIEKQFWDQQAITHLTKWRSRTIWGLITIKPLELGKGRVENKIKGGAIPKEFIPGVEKRIEISDNGISRFPIIDYK